MTKPLRITLLGSNSGRNAGDAAILGAIMSALSKEFDGNVEFEVPTTHPKFVEENYGNIFSVTPINIMPWTGSIRLLGVPTFRSIARTDLTFVTDGIIFDVKLFNPLFNFLITLVFLAPWIKFCGRKLICYNVGIGPLRSFFGRLFAKWVGNSSDLIMVRDEDSKKLFEEIGVTKPIEVTADAVFLNWSAEEKRIKEIIKDYNLEEAVKENTLFGVNVTRYADRWLGSGEKLSSKEEFIPLLASTLAKLRAKKGITPVLFITQVMDAGYGRELQEETARAVEVACGKRFVPPLLSNETLNNHELMGVMERCRLFIGMRLHSLILASRAKCPVVGLVYAPKVRSFLAQLDTPEWRYELARLGEEALIEGLSKAWEESSLIKETQQKVALELEGQARRAAQMIQERYGEKVETSSVAVNR